MSALSIRLNQPVLTENNMLRTRPVALFLLAACTLSLASCSSDNEGKIVGKWKMTTSSNAAITKDLADAGMYMYFDFGPDGKFTVGVDSDREGIMELIKMSGKGTSASGKYSLGSGDLVKFSDYKGLDGKGFDGKDKAQSRVKITGDNMVITDPDGTTMQFVRLAPSGAGSTPTPTPPNKTENKALPKAPIKAN